VDIIVTDILFYISLFFLVNVVDHILYFRVLTKRKTSLT